MIKKIVEAERPVMLTFGRIKDKYAAQQFYGVDIPKLASFASTSMRAFGPGLTRRSN